MIANFSIGIDQKSKLIVVREEINFFTGSFLFTNGMIFLLSGETLFIRKQFPENLLRQIKSA